MAALKVVKEEGLSANAQRLGELFRSEMNRNWTKTAKFVEVYAEYFVLVMKLCESD